MKSNLKMKLANIQVNLKAKKSRYNGFGKYNYRAAEDILEAIKPFLDNEKVTVTINEEMISFDPPILKSTASILDAESDDAIHSDAIVGVDLMSKGMSMPQKFGAASSYGKKYALCLLYTKAVKFIEGGGDLTAIAGKYDLSKEIKKALEEATPIKTETL